jgi:hypothetical protein
MNPDRIFIRRILYICSVLRKETAAISAMVEGPHLLITDSGRHSVARLSAFPHWSAVLWYSTAILKQAGSDDGSFAITEHEQIRLLGMEAYSLWIQKASQLTYTDACANITGRWGYLKPQEFALPRNKAGFCRCVSLFTSKFYGVYFWYFFFKAYRSRGRVAKTWFCSHSLTEIEGSNPTRCMDVSCECWVLCR